MKSISLLCRGKKIAKSCRHGMTLLELLIAVMMLVTFTSVVVMVMEFTFRFLGEAERASGNGVLIDHAEAQYDMDQLVEMLSQPGIGAGDLRGIFTGNRCSVNPVKDWSLPSSMSAIVPPLGYRFCLSKILHSSGNTDVYMLQALPEGAPDPSRLPVRRLFCRPRPFC